MMQNINAKAVDFIEFLYDKNSCKFSDGEPIALYLTFDIEEEIAKLTIDPNYYVSDIYIKLTGALKYRLSKLHHDINTVKKVKLGSAVFISRIDEAVSRIEGKIHAIKSKFLSKFYISKEDKYYIELYERQILFLLMLQSKLFLPGSALGKSLSIAELRKILYDIITDKNSIAKKLSGSELSELAREFQRNDVSLPAADVLAILRNLDDIGDTQHLELIPALEELSAIENYTDFDYGMLLKSDKKRLDPSFLQLHQRIIDIQNLLSKCEQLKLQIQYAHDAEDLVQPKKSGFALGQNF